LNFLKKKLLKLFFLEKFTPPPPEKNLAPMYDVHSHTNTLHF
jgi:hypothetical protein